MKLINDGELTYSDRFIEYSLSVRERSEVEIICSIKEFNTIEDI